MDWSDDLGLGVVAYILMVLGLLMRREDKPKVVILRGPSGSGKTAYCKAHYPSAWVCSADKFFYQDGDYLFDPKLLPKAHSFCEAEFLEGLNRKQQVIVVDNTNLEEWEWKNYATIAKMFGYRVVLVEFVIHSLQQVKLIASRNIHGVPLGLVANQALRFQGATDTDPDLEVIRLLPVFVDSGADPFRYVEPRVIG